MEYKLKFDEGKHEYSVGKEVLESVTTFIGRFFAEFNQEEIATKLSVKSGKPVEEYYKDWQNARDHGTRVHNAIENYVKLTGRTELYPEDIVKYHEAIRVLDLRPGEFKKDLELKLFDLDYKLAGTIDYIEYDTKNRIINLMDWKTNKSIHKTGFMGQKAKEPISHLDDCSYNKYALQLSLYANLILKKINKRKRKPYKLGNLFLVHLLPSGRKIYKIKYLQEEVDSLLQWRLENE